MDQKDKARKVKYPIYQYFEYSHLPERLHSTAGRCHNLASLMIDELPDCGETREGLRKLLEAKDCFVRANLGVK